jgi:hypothetical protein
MFRMLARQRPPVAAATPLNVIGQGAPNLRDESPLILRISESSRRELELVFHNAHTKRSYSHASSRGVLWLNTKTGVHKNPAELFT